MTRSSLEAVFGGLNAAHVRYLVAGGLAVVAHGLVRFTADVDLALDPDPASLDRALTALETLGYAPRAPVPLRDFVDPARRNQWAREKGMTVFSLRSPQHELTEVDLFVEFPFEFEEAYARTYRAEIAPGLEVTFVGFDDLLRMKRAAGRPRDLEDIAGLESLERDEGAADE